MPRPNKEPCFVLDAWYGESLSCIVVAYSEFGYSVDFTYWEKEVAEICERGRGRVQVPLWAALDPDATLISSAGPVGNSGRADPQVLSGVRAKAETRPETAWQMLCAPKGGSLVVTNVNEFATLRSGTSYYDPIVGEAPLGATLSYTGSRKLAKPARAQQCDSLCHGAIDGTLDGSGQSALRQCFEDDVFWFNVRTTSGQVGWISGKYLEVVQ